MNLKRVYSYNVNVHEFKIYRIFMPGCFVDFGLTHANLISINLYGVFKFCIALALASLLKQAIIVMNNYINNKHCKGDWVQC